MLIIRGNLSSLWLQKLPFRVKFAKILVINNKGFKKMAISFSLIRNPLRQEVSRVDGFKQELNKLKGHKDLLEQLDKEVRKELNGPHQTFNWEMHPTNKVLLDKIYDAGLVDGILEEGAERVYAFTEREQIETLVTNLQVSLRTKAEDVQKQTQLHGEKKQELMRFYHDLLDIISKLSQAVLTAAQRI